MQSYIYLNAYVKYVGHDDHRGNMDTTEQNRNKIYHYRTVLEQGVMMDLESIINDTRNSKSNWHPEHTNITEILQLAVYFASDFKEEFKQYVKTFNEVE